MNVGDGLGGEVLRLQWLAGGKRDLAATQAVVIGGDQTAAIAHELEQPRAPLDGDLVEDEAILALTLAQRHRRRQRRPLAPCTGAERRPGPGEVGVVEIALVAHTQGDLKAGLGRPGVGSLQGEDHVELIGGHLVAQGELPLLGGRDGGEERRHQCQQNDRESMPEAIAHITIPAARG